jgi:hypothetical protein
MGKLHELLAVEETVVAASEKLLAETNEKFNKHTEFFTGGVRTLSRLKDSVEDKAIEAAARRVKELPTDVPSTLLYIYPFVEKALDLKLSKHLTNQRAVADIELDGAVVAAGIPVDFLLDLEKMIPKWRAMYLAMPTLDPSREWVLERAGVWKSEAAKTSQTEKIMYPVELSPATEKHPAQVKEATKDVVVGIFSQTDFNGAATTEQKADVLALCDRLLIAVKQARMRANSVDVTQGSAAKQITALFGKVFS